MDHTALIAKDLTKVFSQGPELVKVLDLVSYRFDQGKSYAITGTSGTGKSTLLHLLAGMENPTQGAVFFEGSNAESLVSHSLGFVFQVPHLIDELTLSENVMIQGLIEQQSYEDLSPRAHLLLDKVGLASKSDYKPRSLSGGEQQRVAVARALFSEPSFIIADEPTAHLDKHKGKELIDLLMSIGCGLIIASHDRAVAERMDVVLELIQGRLVERTSQVESVVSPQELYE